MSVKMEQLSVFDLIDPINLELMLLYPVISDFATDSSLFIKDTTNDISLDSPLTYFDETWDACVAARSLLLIMVLLTKAFSSLDLPDTVTISPSIL